EAHYTAAVSRLRNQGTGAHRLAPYATDGGPEALPQMVSAPHPEDRLAFASQIPLPPMGRPGHQPFPTQALDAQDSYFFARAVEGHSRHRNAGIPNPII
ncbi:unnamed protein product, partial [Polarella glacialis]